MISPFTVQHPFIDHPFPKTSCKGYSYGNFGNERGECYEESVLSVR